MSDNILDKIRSNRKRAVVPTRNAPLPAPPLESQEETSHELPGDAARGEVASTLEELKAELVKIPPTRRHSAIVSTSREGSSISPQHPLEAIASGIRTLVLHQIYPARNSWSLSFGYKELPEGLLGLVSSDFAHLTFVYEMSYHRKND